MFRSCLSRSGLAGLGPVLALAVAACTPIAPAVTPPPGVDATWLVFAHPTLGFSLRYPPDLTVGSDADDPARGSIGDKIRYVVGDANDFQCRGECPVVENQDEVNLGDRVATRYDGYLGAVGGNVPQRYLAYLIEANGRFYTFTLYALPWMSTLPGMTEIQPLQPADVTRFEQIMATVRLTP